MKSIRRTKRSNLTTNSKSILELEILSEEYQKNNFLFYDSSHDEMDLGIGLEDDKRVLVLATCHRNIDWLTTFVSASFEKLIEETTWKITPGDPENFILICEIIKIIKYCHVFKVHQTTRKN